MDNRILIVHSDPEMTNIIRDILDDIRRSEGHELIVRRAGTQAAALELATKESFDLVVTGLDITPDNKRSGPAGEHGKGGQDLIRNLRQSKQDMAAVLISGHVDDDIYDFIEQEDVSLAREGKDFVAQLSDKVKIAMRTIAIPRIKHVDIEISLDLDHGGCFYQFQREGQAVAKPHLLDMDSRTLKELVDKSREIHVGDKTWKRELREVGESLASELFSVRTPNNATFLSEFKKSVGAVHGVENIRIRFVVEEALHPLAFEALKEKGEKEFLMLSTPIYRRLERPIESLGLDPRGLFQDEETRTGPINILIINANVPDDTYLVDENRQLDMEIKHLGSLEKEVEAINTLLLKLKGEGRSIGEIRIIEEAKIEDDTTFAQTVKETLENENWHIVHYGGHTHFDSDNEIGYVFFPGRGVESVKAEEIDMFALWLRSSTRFVFLSSCTSAEHAFMFCLAKQGIPAIMGFLWKVQDRMARDFAETFYTYLFGEEEQSLEYASWRAKVDMYAKHKNNPIWAAPVLVMEVGIQEPRYAA